MKKLYFRLLMAGGVALGCEADETDNLFQEMRLVQGGDEEEESFKVHGGRRLLSFENYCKDSSSRKCITPGGDDYNCETCDETS